MLSNCDLPNQEFAARGLARRKTVVVSGPLALRMRKIEAARAGELGVDVTTLPSLAARLAGGFCRPAVAEDVLPAIAVSLLQGRLRDLGPIAGLPGMPRAIARTLGNRWRSGDDLSTGSGSGRHDDLTVMDGRVRAALAPGVLVAPDLRDAALSHLHHAPTILGIVKLEGVIDVDVV